VTLNKRFEEFSLAERGAESSTAASQKKGAGQSEMTNTINATSPRNIARLAGLFYLLYMITFATSFFIHNQPIVWGDAAATARNIAASELRFRVGFMSEEIATVLFLATAWALYVLLKPVDKNLALLFVLFNLAGVAVEAVSAAIHFSAFLFVNSSDYPKVFTADQLNALAMSFLYFSGIGGIVSGLFYGVWLFPLGYLVMKSGFLPRILGILLVLDGVSLLICFFQLCLFPNYKALTFPLYPIMFIAEFGLAVWLLTKGVNERTLVRVESS
jgi:hypothetical protein